MSKLGEVKHFFERNLISVLNTTIIIISSAPNKIVPQAGANVFVSKIMQYL